jgi:hypothetical protein
MQRCREEAIMKLANGARPAGTDSFLAAGVIFGPMFYFVSLAQALGRAGFDLRRHALSALTLGDWGWVQTANFVASGLLAILCAVGMRRRLGGNRAGTWGPVLVGACGVGMMVGGIFHPDPGLGFPPGAPMEMPTEMSWHGAIHSAGFYSAFLCLIVASFAFARRFGSLGQRGWSIYCGSTGVFIPVLIVLGSSIQTVAAPIFAVAGALAFGWVSVMAAELIHERTSERNDRSVQTGHIAQGAWI